MVTVAYFSRPTYRRQIVSNICGNGKPNFIKPHCKTKHTYTHSRLICVFNNQICNIVYVILIKIKYIFGNTFFYFIFFGDNCNKNLNRIYTQFYMYLIIQDIIVYYTLCIITLLEKDEKQYTLCGVLPVVLFLRQVAQLYAISQLQYFKIREESRKGHVLIL